MYRSWLIGLGAVVLACVVTQAKAQQIVVDEAGLLNPQEEERLAYTLQAYADRTSNQFAIRIIQTLDGSDIATYAIELGQSLGVGQEDKDNGLLIVVARDEREIFIAVGQGLEGVIPDILASQVIRQVIQPAFREGQFYNGLVSAVDVLMEAADGEYLADSGSGNLGYDTSMAENVLSLLFVLFIVGVIVVSLVSRRGGGGRPPRGKRRSMDGVIPLIYLLGSLSGRGSGGFGGGGGFSSGFGGGGFSGGFGGGGFGGGGAGGSW